MKIAVVSTWYNEAFLAPFFLGHYQYADEILIFLDTETDDETLDICSRFQNVKVENFHCPGGVNLRVHVETTNAIVPKLGSDWAICVDADEFVFPIGMEDPRSVLGRVDGNMLFARMWQIYRHETDSDLDPMKPALLQRRHGDPNVSIGINRFYNKPIISKPEVGAQWTAGFHSYRPNPRIRLSKINFIGAHWQMADADLAIQRRIKGQRDRQSRENLLHRWCHQHYQITEEKIAAECREHLHDPQLF